MGRLYETHVNAIVEADPSARFYEVHVSVILDDGSGGGGGNGESGTTIQGTEVQGAFELQGIAPNLQTTSTVR